MKKVLFLLVGLGVSSYSSAENLLEVYEQAKLNNPQLHSAAAQKEKAFSAITGARASLLPQLGLSGSYGVTHGKRINDGAKSKQANIALGLTQTLFDFGKWETLNIVQKQAVLQDISYRDQEQLLILNTTTAYFEVLNAIDTLRYLQAQKTAFSHQLQQTKQKYRVGLVSITDVQNIKANYDQTLAQLVAAQNTLNNNIEQLRQVTGLFYANLAQIDNDLFRTQPPEKVDQLLKQAESTNSALLLAKLSQQISKDQIRLAQSDHLPKLTISASAGLNRNKYYGNNIDNVLPGTGQKDSNDRIAGEDSIALNLDLPVFTSGATYAKVKQAQYDYIDLSQQLESTNRKIVNLVRSSHNNISAAISAIKAYEQTVISAQSSLNATLSGYNVGTRTIVDVLSATTALYDAKKQLSNAKYDYVIGFLNMKYATGTLDIKDLIHLNAMLGKNIATVLNEI